MLHPARWFSAPVLCASAAAFAADSGGTPALDHPAAGSARPKTRRSRSAQTALAAATTPPRRPV